MPGASMPVPSVASPSAPSTSAEDRPGAVTLIVGDILQRRAPQAASRREKRDRLQAIGLAGAVRPHQHHHIAPRLHARRAIIAEVREREAVDTRGGHANPSLPGLTRQSIVRISGQFLHIGLASRDSSRQSDLFSIRATNA